MGAQEVAGEAGGRWRCIGADCGGTNLAFGRYDPSGTGARLGYRRTPGEAAAIPGAIVAAFGRGSTPR